MNRVKRAAIIVAFLLAAAAYGYVSAVQAMVLWSALASLALTVAAAVSDPEILLSAQTIALAEYWIALVVWIGVPVVLLVHKGVRQRLVFFRNTSGMGEGGSAQAALGRLVLLTMGLVALAAPIIAPVSPLAQGDLSSTRHIAPFRIVSAWEELPAVPLSNSGIIERTLQAHSHYLLHRSVSFSAATGTEDVSRFGMERRRSYHFLLLCGTDGLARDVFSRVVFGTRASVAIGCAVVLCSLLAGSIVGFSAGLAGGVIERILVRMVDLLLCVPPLFLVLALMAFLGTSSGVLVAALSATGWMGIARIVRGEVLHLRNQEYVLSARLLGVRNTAIVRTHLVPHIAPVLVASGVLQLGNAILAEASLSFLGLGIQPPAPSWGSMIAESMSSLSVAWWQGLMPGAALTCLLLAVHLYTERFIDSARRGKA